MSPVNVAAQLTREGNSGVFQKAVDEVSTVGSILRQVVVHWLHNDAGRTVLRQASGEQCQGLAFLIGIDERPFSPAECLGTPVIEQDRFGEWPAPGKLIQSS